MRSLKRRPRAWVTLAGREEDGTAIRFHMRPAMSIEFDQATARSQSAMRKLAEAEEVRAEYGLDELPPEFVEEGEMALIGVSTTLLATELAMIIADDFSGYADENGEPEPFNRRNVALAMSDWADGRSVAQRFLDRALVSVYEARLEGKPFAAAPNGTGAAAKPIADPAAMSTPPAPQDGA